MTSSQSIELTGLSGLQRISSDDAAENPAFEKLIPEHSIMCGAMFY